MEKLLQINWVLLANLSLPMLLLTGAGLIILLWSAFAKKISPSLMMGVTVAPVAAALFLTWKLWLGGTSLSITMMLFDRMAYAIDMIFLTAFLLTLLLSKDYLSGENIRRGEYHALLFFAVLGMMLINHGADLIVIFLGIELMSIASYILTGMKRGVVKSYEAALKYFILGSFASGFLLYGIALIYGAVGATSLVALQEMTIPPTEPVLVLLSVAFLMIGLGFKIAAVPFHLWSPDVYEGAPTPITAFMASAVKAAGFAALLRIVMSLGHLTQIPWVPILWTLSVLTMTVGNLVALRQTNIKRMLAYSSIAHAGYALVGVTAALQSNALTESTIAAVIFYLFAYSLTTLGAFAVVIALGRRGDDVEELTDLLGLSERHPVLAAAMAIFMLSLTGIPPTIGFMGKFYLFAGAIESGLYGLVVIGVLNSVVSVFYYLGPVVQMYFQKHQGTTLPPLSYPLIVVVSLCLLVVLYCGLFPSEIFLMARESVRELVF